jgi:hypothetical protein
MSERERVWEGLSTGQGDGRACVACGRDYLHSRQSPTRRVPVGRSLSTGSQVFACVGECAVRAAVRCYPGGVMAISGVALSEATRALHRATAVEGMTVVGDPLRVGEVVCAVVAAAAPLVIAAELRRLTEVFDDRARAVWSQIADTVAALEGTDPAGQRHEALLECAYLTRALAFGMDPAGGSS